MRKWFDRFHALRTITKRDSVKAINSCWMESERRVHELFRTVQTATVWSNIWWTSDFEDDRVRCEERFSYPIQRHRWTFSTIFWKLGEKTNFWSIVVVRVRRIFVFWFFGDLWTIGHITWQWEWVPQSRPKSVSFLISFACVPAPLFLSRQDLASGDRAK